MKNLESLGIKVTKGQLLVLDQSALPQREDWELCQHPKEMVAMIQALKVRGAPLIGVAAALSLASFAESGASEAALREAAQLLRSARPTAVNLMHAIDRMLVLEQGRFPSVASLTARAEAIFEEDIELCEGLARFGLPLIGMGEGILTHCNSGGLATVGIGTALGVLIRAHQAGKKIHVYVDETRPLLQGARLTAWELAKFAVPFTLICDNMAATLMRQGRIQKVFLGADRVALNGDFANKIGTYSVAVAAKHHNVAFHPVAPFTTIDLKCESGSAIPIEDRAAAEVRGIKGAFGSITWAPNAGEVFNPAFDVTPVALVTGLVTDRAYYSQAELLQGALARS